ncbi:IS3 family transposase [Virgibacillus oceani]|uniref:IS3 family transposase n=1 Tax=Virgibacillus oceani TaxID=1479511 RepID=UPI0035715CCD
MNRKYFTQKEKNILNKNPYVKSVGETLITYTDEFKRIFIAESEIGKLPKEIFEDCGFDVDLIGGSRIRKAAYRWRKAYKESGLDGLTDSRKDFSGRPNKENMSLEEKNARLEAQIQLLKAENELLKKLKMMERGRGKVKISAEQKFLLIRSVIEKFGLKRIVKYLCTVAGVSTSGYYNYFSLKSQQRREQREKDDLILKENILKANNHGRNKNKGAKQIKMTLFGEYQINYNLKRIRRVMKKYNIVCEIRRSNPYKKIAKATKEHAVLPNLLNREFKQNTPGKVLLTDITYLYYGKGQKAYLSTIIDGSTNEVLAYHLSSNIKLEIATETLNKLKKNRKVKLDKNALIHSDQGVHYTSPKYQNKVRKLRLNQSMSRRGNCWDNALQESFFGHLKDEVNIKQCGNLCELKREIKSYIRYYNNSRYQWNLKKMTPVQFRSHLQSAA